MGGSGVLPYSADSVLAALRPHVPVPPLGPKSHVFTSLGFIHLFIIHSFITNNCRSPSNCDHQALPQVLSYRHGPAPDPALDLPTQGHPINNPNCSHCSHYPQLWDIDSVSSQG